MPLRILHCVEFYHPSPGGAQAVVRHVSGELVRRGHEVTVATTAAPAGGDRRSTGSGSRSSRSPATPSGAPDGEVEATGLRIRRRVRRGDDLCGAAVDDRCPAAGARSDPVAAPPSPLRLLGAATTLLSRATSRACPALLREFDELIFHSSTYQDIEFARRAGLENLNVVPNGADREEFEDTGLGFPRAPPDRPGRRRCCSPSARTTGCKGHALAIEGFRQRRDSTGHPRRDREQAAASWAASGIAGAGR